MAKNKEETTRSRVRAVINRNGAFNALNELRSSAPSNYRSSVQVFKQIAVLESTKLLSLGPKEFGHLVWHPPLAPISLKNELAWATVWLSGQSANINNYRRFANELQEFVLAETVDIAAAKLDDFCVKSGWSLWAVELRLALEQLTNGTDAQKSLLLTWKLAAPNRIASLIAQIVSDRNDPTFSYDAFYWKCLNSFPRFTSFDWLPTYLMYRSLSHLDNKEESLSIILSRELTSSLIDYYEAIIETLFNIADDTANLNLLRSDAVRIIDSLLKDGYIDCRLQKLRFALTGAINSSDAGSAIYSSSLVQLVYDACMSRFCWDEVPSNLPSFLEEVIENIRQCNEKGIQAQEAITSLIKLGINLKSLDIGITIGMSPQLLASDLISSGSVLPLAMTLTTCGWEFEDLTALDDETIRLFLETSVQDSCCVMHKQANGFLNVLNGQSIETLKVKDSLIYIWLGRQLIMQKRWNEALWLCSRLSQFSSFWHRQSAKIHLSVLTGKGDLKDALELIVQWLLKSSHYASEFPVTKIFSDRSWSEFAGIDPVLVGFVSHHAYIATEDQDIHYICKMACRALALNGGRISIAELFEATRDEGERARLLAFMKDVWIEENFAFIEDVESTEDARNEQMQVMQLLMEWDEANAPDYVNAIKELTLDQTLRNGLRQIDRTRVFVNEVALYRWAEKELYQDYERWAKLLESHSNATDVSTLFRTQS